MPKKTFCSVMAEGFAKDAGLHKVYRDSLRESAVRDVLIGIVSCAIVVLLFMFFGGPLDIASVACAFGALVCLPATLYFLVERPEADHVFFGILLENNLVSGQDAACVEAEMKAMQSRNPVLLFLCFVGSLSIDFSPHRGDEPRLR